MGGTDARVGVRLRPESTKKRRTIVILVVASICITLNLYTFALSYPQIFVLNSGCCATEILAKDFSAYYTAAWRLVHDPANVYTPGLVSDGGPQILPHPQNFKYLPSFLLFIEPLVFFSYQNALVIFDCVQIVLLPFIAFMLYRLSRSKGLLTTSLLMIVALLQPSPTLHWGLSVSYFWQWQEGQDKVLNTVILLASFYFGTTKRPILSGIMMALGSFDPRFFLLALPLFWYYNATFLKRGIYALVVSFLLLNSVLLVPGLGSGFVTMSTRIGLETPLFYYGLIPLLTLASLIIVNARELYRFFASLVFRGGNRMPAIGRVTEK